MSTAFEPNELHTVRGTQHAARCVYATPATMLRSLQTMQSKRGTRRENESVAGIKRHKGALKVRHRLREREREAGGGKGIEKGKERRGETLSAGKSFEKVLLCRRVMQLQMPSVQLGLDQVGVGQSKRQHRQMRGSEKGIDCKRRREIEGDRAVAGHCFAVLKCVDLSAKVQY